MHELTLYQRILESNLVNFIIMVSILVLIFKKAKLGVFIDKMAQDIKTSVNTSAEAVKNVLDEYKNTRKDVRNLPELKAEIIQKAKETSLNMKQLACVDLEKETNALDVKLEEEKNSIYNKTKKQTADEIYDVVIKLAEDEILKRLTPSMQEKLIEKSIEELEKTDITGSMRI